MHNLFWGIISHVVCGPQTTKTRLMLPTLVFFIFLAEGLQHTESSFVVSTLFIEDAESVLHVEIGELWGIIPFTSLFVKRFISRPCMSHFI